jgi:hypothetical protein
MALLFRELHRAPHADALNEEWMILENTGPGIVKAQGCSLTVAKNASERPRALGTLEPGFVLGPNERIRLVSGAPMRKAQGTPPAEEDGLKNYHLFLKQPALTRPGVVVRLSLKQLELAKAVYGDEAKDGIRRE